MKRPAAAARTKGIRPRPVAQQRGTPDDDMQRRNIAIIVLGDLGRSPRMQYHAWSLLEQGHRVVLCGYAGEDVIPPLQDANAWRRSGGASTNNVSPGGDEDALLKIIRMKPPSPPKSLRRRLLPLYLLLRLVGLVYSLLRTLFITIPTAHHRKDANGRKQPVPVHCVLVQNPPSIPLLLLAYLFCISRPLLLLPRPGLVIDWHNLGYTMFDVSDWHPIRMIARVYERTMAPRADGHLCVTSAMKRWLQQNFGLANCPEGRISVLHDRPPEFFRPTKPMEQHRLMKRLESSFRTAAAGTGTGTGGLMERMGVGKHGDTNRTLFTEIVGGKARLRQDRPALVISSTSWTPDEDFSILLDACVKLDTKVRRRGDDGAASSSPHVVVIVTGKGPQKEMYEERISRLQLEHVSILTMWLEAADYPLLLGCADLGVSLHTSTSGIDLPMKILDLFGCEVPVCAIGFDCLDELVVDGKNGRVFSTSSELAEQLVELLDSVPNICSAQSDGMTSRATGELERLRKGIRGMTRWRENWNETARDIIIGACPRQKTATGPGNNSGDGTYRHQYQDDGGDWDPPLGLKLAIFFSFFFLFYWLTRHFVL